MNFDWKLLSPSDRKFASRILGGEIEPDLIIAPDGKPYLYRWDIVHQEPATVYLHVQVASDPERGLHDHPFDNTSIIISGGYEEHISHSTTAPTPETTGVYHRRAGEVIYRQAGWPHRLIMPRCFPYTMTIFSAGPSYRDWGFWRGDKWTSYREIISSKYDKSVEVHYQDLVDSGSHIDVV